MKNEPTTTSINTTKNKAPLPIVAAVVGAGLVAFVAGRVTSPAPAPTTSTTESGSAEAGGEHAGESHESHEGEGHADSGGEEKGHAEGDSHAEGEGHAEGKGHSEGEGEEKITFDEAALKTAKVQVAPVALMAQTSGIPFSGQLAPNPNGVVRVASVVPGRITRLMVSVGDNVRQGQTVAVVESRAVGEAQSAYQQASARLQNARANLNVVLQQAKAGVFSRAPVEAARRAQVEAIADVRNQETAVRQTRVAFDNILRQARIGSFASPALEAARSQSAAAKESLQTAEAALSNAKASVTSAESELSRRRQLAAGGTYVSRPVEEAKRSLITARASRGAAQSDITVARASLNRAKSLAAEGLVSQRDLETAQQALATATARLETAEADEATTQQELERQQKIAASNVAGNAEISAAQSALAGAQSDVRTREGEVARAREGVRLAGVLLSREQATFQQDIANRREISQARGAAENARNALSKARQTLTVANAAYQREVGIQRQNLNNIAQVQAARSTNVQAESDLRAASTALALFKSAPGGRASVPITSPISGVVQEREVAQGEVLDADAQLMTIVNLNTVAVEAALPEADIARVRIGSQVKVNVDGFPGRQFTGRINYVGSRLDPGTRTLKARALLQNEGGLRAGMAARGQIVTDARAASITVPAAAIQTLEDKMVVFVQAEKPTQFVAREVERGATEAGRTVIKNGLKPGEKVVTSGAFMVKAQAMKAELGHSH